jgi:hypothetical protein
VASSVVITIYRWNYINIIICEEKLRGCVGEITEGEVETKSKEGANNPVMLLA